ncbi:MAG: hypothetical protein IJ971_04775 [Bacteroidales bacterium]|nr:hypothetical protein [Bacteroidales bacterium]
MKKIIYISLTAVILFASAISTSAQMNGQGDWKQRMLSEKVAFLTIELGITPEEAQKFWPVYNQVDKERDEAMLNVFKAFKDLENGVAAGKSEKEVGKLLDTYLKAMERQREVEDNAASQYRKVLSIEKVAKLYVGEEKFRRQHIRRLHGGPGGRM